jgi:hypothetical protein
LQDAADLLLKTDLKNLPEGWQLLAAQAIKAYADSIIGLKK